MLEKVISILFPVFAVVAAGFFVGKAFKPDMRHINRINIDLMVPCLVFTTLSVMPMGGQQNSLIAAAVLAVLLPGVLMFGIGKVMSLPFKTWGPPQMFRNSGNLAIPLFGYAFGVSAEAPAVLLFVVSVILHITVGMALLSNSEYRFNNVLRMPLLWAAMLALIFNFNGWTVWSPLNEGMTLVGNAAVPVMLISLGVQLTAIKWSGIRVGVLSTVLSLVTGAISFTLIYFFIPLPSEHMRMMLLFAMLPPAVMNFLYAERFKVGADEVASMVLFGNGFTVLTLPLLLIAAFAWL
ncbi:putative transporter YfdV [Grimontia celer]|uniref:Putative transporter YfdV n=1 Tax=Grimontia celer TaxID=1796497 RepID=A0A128F6R3_9GAMM|nr:AEC family transporter [Grimontia celer]CZF81981.1 putative transporter YfdV [Grimontia celer]